MLNAMRDLWEEGTPEAKREAARIAKDAAPYVHPRLSNWGGRGLGRADDFAFA